MNESDPKQTAKLTPYLLVVFVGCWLGGVFDGMDSTLMSVVLPVAVAELIGTTAREAVSQVGSYVSCMFLLGWMTGGILFGVVGDKLGRIRSMIMSILLYALFTGLSGFSQHWIHLALCRYLTGLGIGGELVTIATFLSEVWPERTRAVAVGMLITSYQAGVFVAGSINYIFPYWRHVFFVGAVPAVLVVLIRLTLRESERWQAAAERRAEASQVRALFTQSHRRDVLVGSMAFAGLLIGYWASAAWLPTWIQSLLPGGAVGSHERSTAVMYQGIAAIAGCASAGWICNSIGRRAALILSSTGCFVASAILFQTNHAFSANIYWENALLGFFIGLCQSGTYTYLTELFPTWIRATGTGFCLNAGRLATAISVYFVGTLVKLLGGYANAAFAFAFVYLLTLVAASVGRETRGKALPE
ncbi:MAG: MFS transporter [Acidobacteriota bacterium]